MVKTCTRYNAGGALTNSSGTTKPTPAVSYTFTPAFVSALGPPERYTDKDLQRATKLALELFVKGQKHGQLQANSTPCKQLLKAWFLILYYRNSYLDCYCFCQQCEHHFKTARANELNQILFVTSFLCRVIVQQCY